MERYLVNVQKITKNDGIESLPFTDDTKKLLLVFQPFTTDFSGIIKYFANENPDQNDEDDHEIDSQLLKRYNEVRNFVDAKCHEIGIKDLSIASYIKYRLGILDLSVKETSSILPSLTNIEEINYWNTEIIEPLINSDVNLSIGELLKLEDYLVLELLLRNFNSDSDILTKNLPFLSQNRWSLFNQWFFNYSESNFFTQDRRRLISNYEILLISVFENDAFFKSFVEQESEFKQFVSTLFACFYLCPLVNERIFIVMKNILFIISQNVEVQEGNTEELNDTSLTTLKEVSSKLSIDSLPYLNKLITSIEKFYQLDMSIKDIIQLVDDNEKQFMSVNKLIEINLQDDLTQLYNSVNWVHTNTSFLNKISRQEIDYIFLNKLFKFKKFSVLGNMVDNLDIPDLSDIILKDFYNNFNQSSNFNLNSHFLQDCMKDLTLLKKTNVSEYTKLDQLLQSFKILNNFKISNNVIRPLEILNMSVLQIIDVIFELNDDVDVFEIYDLTKKLIIGLDDELLQKELLDTDTVYEYKHLSKTNDRLLVKLLLIDLKYSVNRDNNYNLIISLLSNPNIADLLVENWFIIYQYVQVPQMLEDDEQEDSQIEQIDKMLKISKIISLFILIIPIEFNSRVAQDFVQLMKELNSKIKTLQESNFSEEAKPKLDLESRIARAFTSSTKDILKDLLV